MSPSPPRGVGFVASLADEFFRRGVSDYIGTAWEVPSVPAKMFAMSFYKALLDQAHPYSIGEAVRLARQTLRPPGQFRCGLGGLSALWRPDTPPQFGPQGTSLGEHGEPED